MVDFKEVVKYLKQGKPVREVCRLTGADKGMVSLVGKALGIPQKLGRPKGKNHGN